MDQTQQPAQGQMKAAEAQRAELERRSKDMFKVYNPTNQDFQIVLNAAISPEIWPVEAHQEAIVPRYAREKYLDEMADKIITAKSDKLIIEENEKRMKMGFPKLDLHTEQFRLESRNLKIMMSKREQILKILDRGLYKEFGVTKTGVQKISDRESKATFDAGIDVLDGTATPSTVPVTPPAPVVAQPSIQETPVTSTPQPATETPAPPTPDVVVEDDDEEDDGQSH
jgi:hypothetical protein